jgi:hypothetical protein
VTNKKDRPELEAALTTGEVVADVVMREDVIADIPIIGTAFKLLKAADTIRDRLFAEKLSWFLVSLKDIPESFRDRIKAQAASSPEESKKVGTTLLLAVERVTDLDKPVLLAQVFLSYVDEVISSRELRRLCQSIDVAFADDLKELLERHKLPEKSAEEWLEALVPSGLARVVGGRTWDDVGEIYYEVTTLGNKLRTAHFHGRKYMQGMRNDD